MRPVLKLVKSSRDMVTPREDREVVYRYPAEDVQWEVSCDGDEHDGPELTSRPTRRRAS